MEDPLPPRQKVPSKSGVPHTSSSSDPRCASSIPHPLRVGWTCGDLTEEVHVLGSGGGCDPRPDTVATSDDRSRRTSETSTSGPCPRRQGSLRPSILRDVGSNTPHPSEPTPTGSDSSRNDRTWTTPRSSPTPLVARVSRSGAVPGSADTSSYVSVRGVGLGGTGRTFESDRGPEGPPVVPSHAPEVVPALNLKDSVPSENDSHGTPHPSWRSSKSWVRSRPSHGPPPPHVLVHTGTHTCVRGPVSTPVPPRAECVRGGRRGTSSSRRRILGSTSSVGSLALGSSRTRLGGDLTPGV